MFSQLKGDIISNDTTLKKSNTSSFPSDSLIKSYIHNSKTRVKKAFDTVPERLATPYVQLKNNAITNFQSQQRSLTGKLNNLMPLSADVYKSPIVLHNANISYSRTDNDGSYVTPNAHAWYGDGEVNSSWSVATIPFDIQFNNQTWADLGTNNFSNVGIHFNKDNYLQLLKKNLKDKFDPKAFLASDLNEQIEAMKKNAGESLKKDLDKINQGFGNELKDKISQLGDLKSLMSKDMHSVREQLLNNRYVQSIAEKEKLLTELQNQKNTGQPVDNKQIQGLQNEIKKLKGVSALVDKVQEYKTKWESSGATKKLKQLDSLSKNELDKVAKNPATTVTLAKQNLQLSGLQKFFLKVNQLNLGQNTLSESPLSVQHLLNKGVNTEFFNKNKSLLLGTGKLKTLNSIVDQPFNNSVMGNDGIARMISVGLGSSSSANSRVSVMTYNQSLGAFDNFSALAGINTSNSFRNTVVTTISNEMPIGERGNITAELSRSATSYQRSVESDSTLPGKSGMQRILNSDNLLNSMAFAVKYEDELADQDLSYGMHVNMTAPGYVNPGNTFLTSGGKELGFNVKKSFWNRKIQASIKNDLRQYNYSDDASQLWRNYYSVMDVHMRLKRGQSIGIRYMPNKMIRVQNGEKSTVTSLQRLSADGTIAQKIGRTYYHNNLTLAWQKDKYLLGSDPVLNNSVTLSSFQNITLNSKLLYLNMQYDYSNNNSQYVYFNSSLMSEAGLTYMVLKKISLSSAISYNSVRGWYRQAGIKQTISGQLNEHFNLNIYVDARRNIKLYQPLLYGLFRTDISINYLIKK